MHIPSDNLERFEHSFFTYNQTFFNDLTQKLSSLKVLEVFAGNGRMASILQNAGVDIKATSLHSHYDGYAFHPYTDVEDIDAVSAVQKYGSEYDILLMCWPTVTNDALHALRLFGKPVLFIGEVSNPSAFMYGGCATDEFFEAIDIIESFNSYQGNYLERAFIAQLKP